MLCSSFISGATGLKKPADVFATNFPSMDLLYMLDVLREVVASFQNKKSSITDNLHFRRDKKLVSYSV